MFFLTEKQSLNFNDLCGIQSSLHQLIDLLRSQNRCRFIKNKYFVVPIQHLEYFRALLHSDSDIRNECIRFDSQPVFFAQLNNAPARLRFFKETGRVCGLNAEDDVIQHAENFNKLAAHTNNSRKYRPLPKFPIVPRDIAVVVDRNIEAQTVIDIIKEYSHSRKQVIPNNDLSFDFDTSMPLEVSVGGATIFVVDVDRFEKV